MRLWRPRHATRPRSGSNRRRLLRPLDRTDLFPDERQALLRGLEQLAEACVHLRSAGDALRNWLSRPQTTTSVSEVLQMVAEVGRFGDPPAEADRSLLGRLASVQAIEDAIWAVRQIDALNAAASQLRTVDVDDPATLRVDAVKAAIEFAAPLGVAGLTIDRAAARAREANGQLEAWDAPSRTLKALTSLLGLPDDPEVGAIRLACEAARLAADTIPPGMPTAAPAWNTISAPSRREPRGRRFSRPACVRSPLVSTSTACRTSRCGRRRNPPTRRIFFLLPLGRPRGQAPLLPTLAGRSPPQSERGPRNSMQPPTCLRSRTPRGRHHAGERPSATSETHGRSPSPDRTGVEVAGRRGLDLFDSPTRSRKPAHGAYHTQRGAGRPARRTGHSGPCAARLPRPAVTARQGTVVGVAQPRRIARRCPYQAGRGVRASGLPGGLLIAEPGASPPPTPSGSPPMKPSPPTGRGRSRALSRTDPAGHRRLRAGHLVAPSRPRAVLPHGRMEQSHCDPSSMRRRCQERRRGRVGHPRRLDEGRLAKLRQRGASPGCRGRPDGGLRHAGRESTPSRLTWTSR